LKPCPLQDAILNGNRIKGIILRIKILQIFVVILIAGCLTPLQQDDNSEILQQETTLENELIEVTFIDAENAPVIYVELAESKEEHRTGLMYRKQLDADRGMLFVFKGEQKQNFWMKNMEISLDIIYLSDEKIIVEIKENIPPCEQEPCVSYPSLYPTKYVLEANAGYTEMHGISEGQKVSFSLEGS